MRNNVKSIIVKKENKNIYHQSNRKELYNEILIQLESNLPHCSRENLSIAIEYYFIQKQSFCKHYKELI